VDDISEEAEVSPPSRRHLARWIALGTALVMAVVIGVLATRRPAAVVEADTPLLGKPAPQISGRSLEGTEVNLASLRGRFVVVNFFASWCEPCAEEAPHLVAWAFAHKSGPNAVSLIGVPFDDPPSAVLDFMRSTGAFWPVVPDPSGKLALEYGVRGPPETFVIAPDGRVIAHYDGPVTGRQLDSLLAQARRAGL